MIHVLAEIELHPGALDAFTAVFAQLTPMVRAEDGCIEYQGAVEIATGSAHQAPMRATVFTVIEKWRDTAALEAHLRAAHMVAHRAQTTPLVLGTTIRVLRSI